VKTGLFLCFLALGGGILSCGDDDPVTPGQNQIVNSLSAVRESGSEITLGASYAICCGPWESPDERPTLKILVYDPDLVQASLLLGLPLATVSAETTLTLPSNGIEKNFLVFLADSATGNEVSSDQDDASGSLTVEVLDCGPPLRIELTMDAILGSEFQLGERVWMTGSFQATVYYNPAPFGCDFAP
jgi:hypothetical protein